MVMSFCAVLLRGVLDEILNLIESVSEEFSSYSCQLHKGSGKQDKMDRNCCEFICGASTIFQGYGIQWNRIE